MTSSYLLRSQSAAQLQLNGTLRTDTNLSLAQGWNMVPYLRASDAAVADALPANLWRDGDFLKTQLGSTRVYDLGDGSKVWFGSLDTMRPGVGYFLRSGAALAFNYADHLSSTSRRLSAERPRGRRRPKDGWTLRATTRSRRP